MFKSFTHLEFIFVWWKLVVEFNFVACRCPNVSTTFVEEAIFSPSYASAPFVEH